MRKLYKLPVRTMMGGEAIVRRHAVAIAVPAAAAAAEGAASSAASSAAVSAAGAETPSSSAATVEARFMWFLMTQKVCSSKLYPQELCFLS